MVLSPTRWGSPNTRDVTDAGRCASGADEPSAGEGAGALRPKNFRGREQRITRKPSSVSKRVSSRSVTITVHAVASGKEPVL